MSRRLDHIGHVVNNLEEAAIMYGKILGLTPLRKPPYGETGIMEGEDIGARVMSFLTGETFIELIQPTKSGTIFDRFLRERGEGLFHLCFLVDDFEAEVSKLKEKGFSVEVWESKEQPGKMRVAWLQPEFTHGIWIELADRASFPPDFVQHGRACQI